MVHGEAGNATCKLLFSTGKVGNQLISLSQPTRQPRAEGRSLSTASDKLAVHPFVAPSIVAFLGSSEGQACVGSLDARQAALETRNAVPDTHSVSPAGTLEPRAVRAAASPSALNPDNSSLSITKPSTVHASSYAAPPTSKCLFPRKKGRTRRGGQRKKIAIGNARAAAKLRASTEREAMFALDVAPAEAGGNVQPTSDVVHSYALRPIPHPSQLLDIAGKGPMRFGAPHTESINLAHYPEVPGPLEPLVVSLPSSSVLGYEEHSLDTSDIDNPAHEPLLDSASSRHNLAIPILRHVPSRFSAVPCISTSTSPPPSDPTSTPIQSSSFILAVPSMIAIPDSILATNLRAANSHEQPTDCAITIPTASQHDYPNVADQDTDVPATKLLPPSPHDPAPEATERELTIDDPPILSAPRRRRPRRAFRPTVTCDG